MRNKVYDCAIAGGGLAGLSLAIQLAKDGFQVIVIEKHKYPFHRVCGEYISNESYDLLERLGVPLATLNLAKINKMRVSAPNGKFLERPLDLGGIGISRYLLDHLLYQIALAHGVKVIQGETAQGIHQMAGRYRMQTTTGDILAKVAVGSFGKKSVLDRQVRSSSMPRSEYVGIKYHIKTELDANVIELHNFEGGYCGISKIEDNKYCMCYLTHSSNLKKYKGDIKLMEREVLYKNPFLQHYFQQSTFLFEQPVAISQISFSIKKTVENGVLMLGDAAGTIAPLCGNGMSLALHSSCIAAPLIAEYLRGKISLTELLAGYDITWKELFANRIRIGAQLQKLFGKNMLTNLAITSLKQFPKIVDSLVTLTHGNRY